MKKIPAILRRNRLPKNAMAVCDLADGYTIIGDAALQLGNTSLALENYVQAKKLDQDLIDLAPKEMDSQRRLSVDIAKIGDITLRQGKSKEALGFYEQVLELRKPLAQVASASSQAKRDLIGAYTRLGDVKLKLGKLEDALLHFKNAMDNSQLLADSELGNPLLQRDLGMNLRRVGNSRKFYNFRYEERLNSTRFGTSPSRTSLREESRSECAYLVVETHTVLCNQISNHVSVHIGQSIVAALETVG